MKSSGRRQVRTPVGNKTKRGAELEGTPKTPSSFEASPEKPTYVDGSSQEPEDRRLQLRSTRRPLQWSNVAKQVAGGNESLENTSSPRQQQGHLKSPGQSGQSKAVAALSPICVNAIHGNSDQPGGPRSGMKRPNEAPPSSLNPSLKDCGGASKRMGAPDDSHCIATKHQGAAESADTGSCPSSPDCRISPFSGERIFIWNNAAFNQRSVHDETVRTCKNTASSSSCCSSASSCGLKATDQDALPDVTFFEIDGSGNCNTNSKHNVSENADAADARQEFSNSELTGLGDHVESSVARKVLFPNLGSKAITLTEQHKGVLQARSKEDPLGIGLDEIEHEIQRLTERLKELQLQKREREEEMKRQEEEKSKKGGSTSYAGRKENANRERSAKPQQQQSKGGVTGTGRGKGAGSSSSSSATVLQSPRSQSHKGYGAVSKNREESPLATVGRRPAGSVSKLSEMRRSVSSASRRMESSNRNSDAESERTKAFRRLSLNGAGMSAPLSVKGEKFQQQRFLSSKGTPSRMVSSRYGRATTPDACRPSGGSSIACKKRDRPSSVASSPLPQPLASVACSPLKKVATLRSGYPSRSGLATPTKEREVLVEPTSTVIRSSNAPAPLSSLRAQNRVLRLHSPSKSPVSRIDSPKSTAALYKCLESLLEDSKHFFKRLSPARSHVLHNLPQLQEPIAAASSSPIAFSALLAREMSSARKPREPALPNINTFRLDAISPRDSGCVKRASDRQKNRFFFAKEEASPQVLEC